MRVISQDDNIFANNIPFETYRFMLCAYSDRSEITAHSSERSDGILMATYRNRAYAEKVFRRMQRAASLGRDCFIFSNDYSR